MLITFSPAEEGSCIIPPLDCTGKIMIDIINHGVDTVWIVSSKQDMAEDIGSQVKSVGDLPSRRKIIEI